MSDTLFVREERVPVAIEHELKRSYLDYAMSVIIGRALPDVRDGLKPVHRRILFGMWEQSNTAGKPYKKSARIVGDVMGKYHPHGDSAIYDTLVRMAQTFSMRHVLVDGQGNFGSVDGDSAAAMRYTEVRLARLAEELLGEDLDKETVGWQPNYDGSLQEPLVLPARFPNLLVNGSSGIAVGMATNIPPHNLGEVIDACLLLAARPGATIEELIEVLPGPTFPPPRSSGAQPACARRTRPVTAAIQMQARARIEHFKKGERTAIVISELPYQVNKARLVERIAELVNGKEIDGIADLRDESDRDGIRVVVDLKRDAVPQVVLNQLYKLDRDAVELRHHLPGDRRQPAAGADPQADARVLPRAPQGSGDPPHPLRPGPCRGAGPHPGRSGHRPRPPRRGDRDDPRLRRPAGCQGRPDASSSVCRRSRPRPSSTCGCNA